MYKLLTTLLISMSFFFDVKSQYYYKEIVSTKEINAEMLNYKNSNIRKITSKSFDANGNETKDLFLEKTFSKDFKSVQVKIKSMISGNSTIKTEFDELGRLVKNFDKSENTESSQIYTYDNNGRLLSILFKSTSSDDDFITSVSEEHFYYYDSKNLPEKMIRVKNQKDSTTILFISDENNQITIEKDTKSSELYYYYYDANNRLSDIVHPNRHTQKINPNYIFEYDDQNRIIKITTYEDESPKPTIWEIKYNGNLKVSEEIFDYNHISMGRVEYNYIQ